MRLVWQIGSGLALAGVLVAALQWWVTDDGSDASAVTENPLLPAGLDRKQGGQQPGQGRQMLMSLRAEAATFHLATVRDDLPAGCAPVFEVRQGGAIRIAVVPPLAEVPGEHRWDAVGVLLPRRRVADLSPAERSSLLAIWSRLCGTAGLTAHRVLVHGCSFAPKELDRLLRWMR